MSGQYRCSHRSRQTFTPDHYKLEFQCLWRFRMCGLQLNSTVLSDAKRLGLLTGDLLAETAISCGIPKNGKEAVLDDTRDQDARQLLHNLVSRRHAAAATATPTTKRRASAATQRSAHLKALTFVAFLEGSLAPLSVSFSNVGAGLPKPTWNKNPFFKPEAEIHRR